MIKWILMTFCWTLRLLPCSTIIREAFFCCRRKLIYRPTTGQCAKKDFEAISSKWNVFNKPLPSGLRDLCGRGSKNVVRARGYGWLQNTIKVMYIKTHRDWQCARGYKASSLTGLQCWKVIMDMAPTCNQKVICNWYLLAK